MIKTDVLDRVITKILLQQHLDSEWYPVAYFLKTIALAKCNYRIYDKEMLAIVHLLD